MVAMEEDKDTSSHTPSGPSQPSTGNTPQPASSSQSAVPANAQLSKRRRGLGIVTPNACTECRKKRAKVRKCPHWPALALMSFLFLYYIGIGGELN